jgi:GDPmannose 4,6-dehydratase
MKRSLVLGVNGQDGSLLAEILEAGGRRVWGLGRQSVPRFLAEGGRFHYLQCDLRDQEKLKEALVIAAPDEIYHLAAVHGPAGFSYEGVWADALDVNVKSLHTALEYAREQNSRDVRLFYASSAKVFGTPLKGDIDLSTPKRCDCLYSVSKLAAEHLLAYYRKTHAIHAGIAYLFNHESVRRPSTYFIPTIANVLTRALKHAAVQTNIFTLSFYCDWGCAREYMDMAVALIEASTPMDLIFATGKTWFGRDLVDELFRSYGLDYRDYLVEQNPEADAHPFQVQFPETAQFLGRVPMRTVHDVCREFVDHQVSTNLSPRCTETRTPS